MNSDVSWLLRRCGISATMFLTHDLRTITNNPLAELNDVQRQLLKEIIENPEKMLFLWGSSGTGKTVLSLETLKIKLSHFKSQNKTVRVIVTQFDTYLDPFLLENIRQKYLTNISDVEILPLDDICEELNIKFDRIYPRDTINKVIVSLSSAKTHDVTIFLCDEIWPCWDKGQTNPDWRDVMTPDNVQWILSLNPRGWSGETINLTPPSHSSVVERKLIHGHRNAYLIRLFNTFYISHYHKKKFIPMNDDQKLEADQLPSGFVPLWFDIKKKGEMSQREILEKISELEEIAGLSVTVLYFINEDSSAKQFCDEIKWKYRHYNDMRGCEDEAVIVLDYLIPESISRPHKLLVMVTTPGAEWYEDNTAELNSALLHSTLGQCREISDCSYTGQTFLQKRNINNVSQLDQNTTDQEEADRQAGADQHEE